MGRPFKTKAPGRPKRMVTMGGKYEVDLSVAMQKLADRHGTSIKEALRRMMIYHINSGTLPGISILELGVTEETNKREQEPAEPSLEGTVLYPKGEE